MLESGKPELGACTDLAARGADRVHVELPRQDFGEAGRKSGIRFLHQHFGQLKGGQFGVSFQRIPHRLFRLRQHLRTANFGRWAVAVLRHFSVIVGLHLAANLLGLGAWDQQRFRRCWFPHIINPLKPK